jgi:hypothetical protein
MKHFFLVQLVFLVCSCSGKPSLNSSDIEYVRTTLDLLHTRAQFIPTEDSVSVERSLDSVYRKHHTSATEYKAQTLSLADEPKRAEVIFNAINDSIGKK